MLPYLAYKFASADHRLVRQIPSYGIYTYSIIARLIFLTTRIGRDAKATKATTFTHALING